MSQPACPVCGAVPRPHLRDWLFKCGGCGLLLSNLQPVIPTEKQESAVDEDVRAAGLDKVRAKTGTTILGAVAQLKKPPARLLDIGCGQGQFLKVAKSFGYECVGIEPDANVVDRTRAMTGLEIRQGFFPDAIGLDERFDVITFNDVFEHLPDPIETLKTCHRYLKEDGVIVLNCPDKNGIFYILGEVLARFGIFGALSRLWQVGLASPHLWYFSPVLMQRLGEKTGFRLCTTQHLVPITLTGLKERIFYVKRESRLLGYATYYAALLMYPFLNLLPRDIGVVIMKKFS